MRSSPSPLRAHLVASSSPGMASISAIETTAAAPATKVTWGQLEVDGASSMSIFSIDAWRRSGDLPSPLTTARRTEDETPRLRGISPSSPEITLTARARMFLPPKGSTPNSASNSATEKEN